LTALVAIVVAIVAWPALSARAIWIDDNLYLTESYLVSNPSWASAWRVVSEVFAPTVVPGYYQPLSALSVMLDFALGGGPQNLLPFHVTNLLLHVANTVLVCVFLYLHFRRPWRAVLAGLIFGLHPLTMEAVPWLSERKSLLASFFALWSLVLYVPHGQKRDWRFHTGSLVMYILSLFSKPTMTPLPVLMLLMDYWPLRRLNKNAFLEKVPFFIVGWTSAVITIISERIDSTAHQSAGSSIARSFLIVCHDIVFYLYKVVWPVGPATHYTIPEPLSFGHPLLLGSVIGTILLIALLVLSLRWTRAIVVGWLFFFIALFPTMGVTGFTWVIVWDKYIYFPWVGLLLPLTWYLGELWGSTPRLALIRLKNVGVLLLVVCVGVFEVAEDRDYLCLWKDSETLCRHMLAETPGVPTLHYALANALILSGKTEEGIQHFREALRLAPHYADAHYDLGVVLGSQGKTQEAADHYREACRLDPRQSKARNNLGTILCGQGRWDEGMQLYREALAINPEFADAHINLGIGLVKLGKPDLAIPHFLESVRLRPGHIRARKYLATALVNRNNIDEAIRQYRAILQLQPEDIEARDRLNVLMRLKRNAG